MLPFLHQPFHLPHQKQCTMNNVQLAQVVLIVHWQLSIVHWQEGEGGEAGERGVYHHTRHRLVWDEVGVVAQQCRRFDGDALIRKDDDAAM